MVYLKDISSVEVGEDGKPKIEVEMFRYENWLEDSCKPLQGLGNENDSLAENLANVFKDIPKQQLIKLKKGSYKKPDILVELKLEWEECHIPEGEECDDYEEVSSCYECPHHKRYEVCFTHSNDTTTVMEDQVLPLEAIGGIIKNMPRKDLGEPWGPMAELKIYNFDTDGLIILCENVGKCDTLRVEIDATEIEATKEVLKQMGLLPKGRK